MSLALVLNIEQNQFKVMRSSAFVEQSNCFIQSNGVYETLSNQVVCKHSLSERYPIMWCVNILLLECSIVKLLLLKKSMTYTL